MNKTIRIISSELAIELPVWVRTEMNVAPTSAIVFTPINGMILLSEGDEYDLVYYSESVDRVYIPENTLEEVGIEAYDLVEIVKIGGDVYLTKYVRDTPTCQVCDCKDSSYDFNGIHMCHDCMMDNFKVTTISKTYKHRSDVNSHIRRVDSRHRISIPREIRDASGINDGDDCFITWDVDGIHINKI